MDFLVNGFFRRYVRKEDLARFDKWKRKNTEKLEKNIRLLWQSNFFEKIPYTIPAPRI